MITGVVLCMVMLCVPGLIPAVAVCGRSVAVVFICPITGALLCAIAATAEFVLPGSFTLWLVVTWILSNALAIGVVVTRKRRPTPTPQLLRFNTLTSVAIVASVTTVGVWFLLALKAPMMGFDTQAIWMLHAMFIYGGHHRLEADLHNRAYGFSNRDYPPLLPSVSALSFIAVGKIDPRAGVIMTALLNACALGVAACGIALVPQHFQETKRLRDSSTKHRLPQETLRWLTQSFAVVLGVAVLAAGFGLAGEYAINGYADLMWAAAATGAVVFGLVLPTKRTNAAMAWALSTTAALTKNEGLPVALVVIGLIAVRYIPRDRWIGEARRSARSLETSTSSLRTEVRLWVRRCTVAAVMAIPGASWAAIAFAYGINNVFFKSGPPGPASARASATVTEMTHYLHVLPTAVVVLVISALCLRQTRRTFDLGNSAWLWSVFTIYVLTLLATYTLGSLPIHWWLYTSIERTMIFPQLLIFTDIAVWAVLGLTRLLARDSSSALEINDRPVTEVAHL